MPFPTDSTFWREFWTTGDSGYTSGSGLNQYFLFGDTVINDIEYNLLYENRVYHPFSPNIPFDSVQITPMGLLREDNKRVYFVETVANTDSFDIDNEQILYDFNLEVGDTLFCPEGQWYGYGSYVTIAFIDSLQTLDGIYRKRYNISSGDGPIIEGIGSVDGLFFPCGGNLLDFVSSLGCMGTVNEYIFDYLHYQYGTEVPPDATCYNLFVSTEEVTYESLTLHPNPTTGIVHLSEPMYDVYLSVYSSIGQKVHNDRAFNGSTIDLNGLVSGVYFVVMLGNGNYLGKVVKE